MFKISWGHSSDPFQTEFVLVPDAKSLFNVHYVITGYGRKDGSAPVNVKVTNLDGEVIDMSKGLAHAASYGTR